MDQEKTPFLVAYFNQIESQVVFGDSKASLMIAGDSILLAITGSLIKTISGCQADALLASCIKPSLPLTLVSLSAVSLVVALAHALYAARPASLHANPPQEFFLMSHVARADRTAFLESFRAASVSDLEQWALEAIHGKSAYASRKFRMLRRAVDATLLSLAFLMGAAVSAVIAQVVG